MRQALSKERAETMVGVMKQMVKNGDSNEEIVDTLLALAPLIGVAPKPGETREKMIEELKTVRPLLR